jgi:hypothetical protein
VVFTQATFFYFALLIEVLSRSFPSIHVAGTASESVKGDHDSVKGTSDSVKKVAQVL